MHYFLEDADSNSVFEDASPSHFGNKVLLSPHSKHISDLSIPITNGIVVAGSGRSNFKYGSDSDIIYDNYHPGTIDTTSVLNSSEPSKDIPSYLLGWNNKTKDQSTVIPESVKCTKNRNSNSTGNIDDGFRKSSAHSERLAFFCFEMVVLYLSLYNLLLYLWLVVVQIFNH